MNNSMVSHSGLYNPVTVERIFTLSAPLRNYTKNFHADNNPVSFYKNSDISIVVSLILKIHTS
jgi:hypothetical protein